MMNLVSLRQLVHDVTNSIDGNGKAGTLHVGSNSSIDSNHLTAFDVYQRSAFETGLKEKDGEKCKILAGSLHKRLVLTRISGIDG